MGTILAGFKLAVTPLALAPVTGLRQMTQSREAAWVLVGTASKQRAIENFVETIQLQTQRRSKHECSPS
jgi:hypothetical protein